MSGRSRPSRVRLHLHCESCFSRRCRAPVEVSVSCALMPCRLLCGAVFHLCKEEEHALLCPNEKVPCLNADFGCPFTMPRHRQASHLETCPSSTVSCSMEWLRWPVDETDPHQNTALHQNLVMENVLRENLQRELGEGQVDGPPLDLAMALLDQKHLFSRLKMKHVYPQLMEEEEEEEEEEGKPEESEEVGTESQTNNGVTSHTTSNGDAVHPNTEQKDAGGSQIDTEKNNELPFSSDRRAYQEAEHHHPAEERQGLDPTGASGGEGDASNGVSLPDYTRSGHAPWEPGVMDRLGKELTPQEMTMYMVHHGRALLFYGQIEACTPRDRDFVYGSLEPIPVQTLRTFRLPISYRSKDLSHRYDTVKIKTEDLGVDTSDLDAPPHSWNADEAAATLLCYAEIEVKGHKISDSKGTDGLFADEGTQTHSFASMPFKRDTVLADVTRDSSLKLRLQLPAESVDSRHHKASSAFTFLCGHSFLRREFAQHFRNVHSDIQMGVSGWFEQRCPLAYLGCTYSQRRFQPSTHPATVTYNNELAIFNLRPTLPGCLEDQPPQSSRAPVGPHTSQGRRGRRAPGVGGGGGGGGGRECLSALPYEVLCHMASFLDSLSLSQLALVSHLMREVCSSLLQTRGMVSLQWHRKTYSHGQSRWKARPVWSYSHLFSNVDSWRFLDTPSMSAHLERCPYFQRSQPSEPWPLTSMGDREEASQDERLSLVEQFMCNR